MKKGNSNKREKKGTTNKKKKKVWKKVLLIMLFIILIAGSVFAYKVCKNGGGMSGMLATVVGHDENLNGFLRFIFVTSTDIAGGNSVDSTAQPDKQSGKQRCENGAGANRPQRSRSRKAPDYRNIRHVENDLK